MDGIKLPEAKSNVAWIDGNTLLVGTDFGPGSMTTSGYPRMIKRWKRGTPLSSAETVLEVPATDVWLGASSYDAGGRTYVRISNGKTFYTSNEYLYEQGKLRKLATPEDADTYLVRDQLIVYVRRRVDGGRPHVAHRLAHRHERRRLPRGQARVHARHAAGAARDDQQRHHDEGLPAGRRAQQRAR